MAKPRWEVKQITPIDLEDPFIVDYFRFVGMRVAKMYGEKFNWKMFRFRTYVAHHRITVCFKNSVPCGMMLMRLFPSAFDCTTTVLYQDLLWNEPGSRAVKYLMDDFIDFGRRNANHVITMIAEKSNVKPATLNKLGFKKLETLYRMEF